MIHFRSLDDIVYKLSCGEKLEKKYKDHILKGRFKGYHECHIQLNWLLIYKIQNDVLILTLVDTGSHADLFNV
ncbi:MAG: type II toxin-antitoxin system YafQ family toxin [Methanobrevibacter sp.]|nr:type II toxin-antitoxin system YafQ family toxin [Methanobrevibacter sp.]